MTRKRSSRVRLIVNSSRGFEADSWEDAHFRPYSCGYTCESKLLPKQALFLDAVDPEGVWIYTMSGHAHYKIGQQKHLLGAGSVFCIKKPHQGWLLRSAGGLPWKYLWIHVTGGQALHFFDFIHEKLGIVHALAPHCKAVQLGHELIRDAQENHRRSAFYWSEKTFLWLQAWWECGGKTTALSPMVKDEPSKSSRLISFTPGSVKKFAEQMGYSRSYLSRKLKVQWGCTPGVILREARMREAEKLLRSTNFTINDIALKVGYSATASFTRAFAAIHHVSPLNYRHKNR